MEPFPGADPGGASLPRTRGRRSEGRELGKRDPDAHCIASETSGLPVTPFPTIPIGALPQGRTGPPPVQEAAGRRSEGHTWCARQDLNLRCPRPQRGLDAAGVRAHGAVIRCRPGSPALRRPGHGLCDGSGLPGKVSNLHCGGQGPEACRLADPALRAEGAIRTRRPRGLSSRGIPVPVTPASCATRDLNPEPSA